jgi:hypothetical protein
VARKVPIHTPALASLLTSLTAMLPCARSSAPISVMTIR